MKYDDTSIAGRYDSARKIPEATLSMWLDAIGNRIPQEQIQTIIDIGCGTGRFSAALADLLDAKVIGIDPSETMLAKARENVHHPKVTFQEGKAESLPAKDTSACLVFLSMVYHHIESPEQAAKEFYRILRPGGFVCIRNSTKDLLDRVPYLKYFPEAMAINRKRIPSRKSIINTLNEAGFSLSFHDILHQKFTDTFNQYCEKIAQRGLSDLIMISNIDFNAGMVRMKQDAENRGDSGPILEPIDLFIFKKDRE